MRETKASAGRENRTTGTTMTATEVTPTQPRANRIIEHMRTGDFFHQAIYASLCKKIFDRDCDLRVGKYKLVRSLGSGGMGEVFVCEDPDLGREIALKRVHAGGGAREQARLQKEARALAQLHDDNIVTVHESGVHEGASFVAMELLEQNLERWLETPRSRSEILDRLIEAGRGLAAVHEAKLVHRDFKPQNVLIDHRGRAKVADFGLVLDQGQTEEFADTPACARLEDERLTHARLSSTGAFLGTPLYMAPEQLRGEQARASSDQFAYCLVLYAALWGASPFGDASEHSDAITTVGERIEQIETHGPTPPRRDLELFAVIRRGLHADPAKRWASMRELLEQLTRARHAPRRKAQRRRRLAGASAGVAALALAVWIGGQLRAPTCDASLEGVWDADRGVELRAHAARLPATHGEDSGARVIESLDEWAEAWAPAHARRCEERLSETDVLRARRSAARVECLWRQARTVSELVDTVLIGDAEDLAQAVLAVEALPEPADCETELAGLGVEPPPAGIRELVAAMRATIDEANALRLLGRWDAAIARAQAVEIAAGALGYAPLLAEAQALLAMAHDEGGDPQRAAELYADAIASAVITHHDQLAADLYVEHTELALRVGDPDAARWLELARLNNERVGWSDAARARTEFAEGRLAAAAKDRTRAAAHYRSAIELGDAERSALPSYLGALAAVSEDPQEALELRRRALDHAIEHFGPHHPRTAIQHFNYGAALPPASEQSARELDAAAEIWAETLPPAHPLRAKLAQQRTMVALTQGRLDEAQGHADEMAAILRRLHGEDHPDLAEPELLLAKIATSRADADPAAAPSLRRAAIDHAERALRSLLADPDPDRFADLIADTLLLLANQQLTLGELDAAERSLGAALERAPDDERVVALSRLRRAELAVRQDHFEEAAALLDAIPDTLEAIRDEQATRAVLLAFVDHRLERPRGSLDLAPESIPIFRDWLEDLGASKDSLRELGLGHAD